MNRSCTRPDKPAFRRVLFCFTLLAAGEAAQCAPEPGDGITPQFAPSGAFEEARQAHATGVYILGATRIRSWTAEHYVLMRNGLVVQIHSHARGAWLPKLEGSSGGLRVGVAKFDKLLSIAGGVNRNAEDLPLAVRNRFYCLAGFGECTSTAPEAGDGRQMSAMTPPLQLSFLGDARANESPCRGCNPYFTFDDAARTARFEFDAASQQIRFEGWGIRASWPVPPLDEI